MTKEELTEAAKEMKQICKDGECDRCPFMQEEGCVISTAMYFPDSWRFWE